MGRKSKRKHHPDPEDVAKADRKEINSLCGQLLEGMQVLLQPSRNAFIVSRMHFGDKSGARQGISVYIFMILRLLAETYKRKDCSRKINYITQKFHFTNYGIEKMLMRNADFLFFYWIFDPLFFVLFCFVFLFFFLFCFVFVFVFVFCFFVAALQPNLIVFLKIKKQSSGEQVSEKPHVMKSQFKKQCT